MSRIKGKNRNPPACEAITPMPGKGFFYIILSQNAVPLYNAFAALFERFPRRCRSPGYL